MAAGPNSTGKVSVSGTTATVSSDVNGKGTIINTLDSTLKTAGATMFVRNNDWTNSLTIPFVGEGTPNVSEELTVNYNFGNALGYSASFVSPMSLNADASQASTKVWLRVVDSKGNAYKDTTTPITFKIDGKPVKANASSYDSTGKTEAQILADTKINVTADGDGFVSLTVPKKDAGKSSTITVKVGDLKEVETVVNWKDYMGFDLQNMEFDSAAKTIKLTFNDDVYADSVNAAGFKVQYYADNQTTTKPVTYDATVASVSGRDVVLQLPKSNSYNWPQEAKFEVTVNEVSPYKNTTDFKYTIAANKTGEAIAKDTKYTITGAKKVLVGAEEIDVHNQKVAGTKAGKAMKSAITAKDAKAFLSAYATYDAGKADSNFKTAAEAEVTGTIADIKTEADNIVAAETLLTAADTKFSVVTDTLTDGASLTTAITTKINSMTGVTPTALTSETAITAGKTYDYKLATTNFEVAKVTVKVVA